MSTETLQAAFSAHIAGNLEEAAAGYHNVVSENPAAADAWHLLGDVRARLGEIEAAFEALNHALSLEPSFPEAHNTIGSLYLDVGQFDSAAAHFNQALQAAPEFAEAHTNLGECFRRTGDLAAAEESSRQSIHLKPELAAAHNNLGAALKDLGQLETAAAAFESAIKIDRDLLAAWINLADTKRLQGDTKAAQEIAEKFMDDALDVAATWNVLGAIRLDVDDVEGATHAIEKALSLSPHFADAHSNLGNIQLRKGHVSAAISAYRTALEIDPDHPDATVNLGTAMLTTGDWPAAIEHYDMVLLRQPDHIDAKWNRSLALLMKGDYLQGFAAYESRWQLPHIHHRDVAMPPWTGQDLTGRSLLVLAEQGFGDTLQMARLIPILKTLGADTTLECHPSLLPLLADIPQLSGCVPLGQPLPQCDFYAPIMSLPYLLGIELDTLPAEVPYLTPPPDRQTPAAIIGAHGYKVGLIWQGRPSAKNFLGRPCPASALECLSKVSDVSLFSLQVGAAAGDLDDFAWGSGIPRLGESFDDFADTATAMRALDLVITIDTASAHLAGALGVKTWTLLSPYADWRWMRDRDDNPWYPTMRLFRQSRPGDWEELLHIVATELKNEVGRLTRRN